MKKLIIVFFAAFTFSATSAHAQFWKDVKNAVKEEVTGSSLTEGEVGGGLKEALMNGINKGVDQLSKPDGYFKDLSIKILLPEEAQKAEQTLRKMGMDKQVDEAIEAMNRAAEDAATGAKDIFMEAVKQMTFQDAMNILKGEQDAATKYLDKTTRTALIEKFQPVIKASLDKVDATKYWEIIFSKYNKVPFVKPINPDLEAYVTQKALDGLFHQIAKQEAEIRTNPGARTSDLLKKVFAN
jgi:nitrogen regulatory protein PII